MRIRLSAVAVLGCVIGGAAVGCVNDVESDEFVETDEIVNPSGDEQALTMPACGTVLATMDGVSSKSNAANTGTGNSCAGQGGIANGLQYQCVEFAQRYFKVMYGLRWYGNAKDLLNNAPRADVDVYLNGDAAHPPVPGDMLVWTNGQWGHVAIIESVDAHHVNIIEQNVAGNGRAQLPWDGTSIGARWSGWVPRGYAHAKANHRTNGGGGGGGGGSTPASCTRVGVTGRTIDDDDDCFRVGGTASYLHASTEGFGGDLVWTHTWTSATPDNFVEWGINVERAGRYRVDAFTDTTVAQATRAQYRVTHADGAGGSAADDVVVDQSSKNGWRALGAFRFATSGGKVRLNDNNGENAKQIVFDALRVVPACDNLHVETDNATLNVRASASTSASIVGSLAAGALVQRLDTVDGTSVDGNTVWHKVQKGGLVGFATGKYLGCPP